jgi:hypothetical protein
MNRRAFLTLLGGAVTAWPLSAGAQQAAVPMIGFLHQGSAGANVKVIDAFRHVMPFAMACRKPDTRRVGTHMSNSVGPMGTTTA